MRQRGVGENKTAFIDSPLRKVPFWNYRVPFLLKSLLAQLLFTRRPMCLEVTDWSRGLKEGPFQLKAPQYSPLPCQWIVFYYLVAQRPHQSQTHSDINALVHLSLPMQQLNNSIYIKGGSLPVLSFFFLTYGQLLMPPKGDYFIYCFKETVFVFYLCGTEL